MAFLTGLITDLAVGIMRWLASRNDLKKSVRKEWELAAKKLEVDGLKWKAAHPIDLSKPDFKLRKRKPKK